MWRRATSTLLLWATFVAGMLPTPAAAVELPYEAEARDLVKAAEGPLPADRRRDLDDAEPTGIWLGATFDGGWLEKDVVLGGSIGVGIEHRLGALHLRAPLTLRAYNTAPHEPVPDVEAPLVHRLGLPNNLGGVPRPLLCATVRCSEWVHGEAWEVTSLGRIIEHLRLGRPGDWFHLSAGNMRGTLGSGLLVDEVVGSPEWDRRATSVYTRVQVPWWETKAELFSPNLLAPQQLTAARLSTHPLQWLDTRGAWWQRLLGRFEVGGELAADLVAPWDPSHTDLLGNLLPGPGTRPLLAGNASAQWPLLPSGMLLQLSPVVGAGASYGLSPTGETIAAFGLGASGGARVDVRIPYVGVRFEGRGFADSPGHRHAVFGPLYMLERRRAVAGAAVQDGGLLRVPAPGGFGAESRAELNFADAISLGGRTRLDPAPGASFGEVYGAVSLLGVQLGGRAIRRGLSGNLAVPISTRRVQPNISGMKPLEVARWDNRLLLALEGSVAIWGPVSLYARAAHAPRTDLVTGAQRSDDDVIVGISSDVIFGADWLGL